MKIKFQQLSIMQLHDLLKGKIYQPEDLISFSLKRLKEFQNLNAVVTSFDKIALKTAKNLDISDSKGNPLFGIPYVTKDNIATIGQKTTGSSGILDNFIPYYDSTVNSILTKACAINLAKTALDELGMGGDGLYAKTGYVYNP
jgi:aspartyl-tRNA(Asn)/glutamyl-tRNA(Gln) amidotransferase subunit A